ncbi:RNA-directed DNA polymerase (reversetranscriptase)-related family protein [Striga asiatica]|uniref:RNA-directed DNA polymerase (Reversetranscriptase)-related family protein n=1 Tax=Striga asiatica TaxID=4170 RepID=A0A5A7PX52_STRAF|nr:RNA-directed DNA polymerase (reversetranscriptase)-related family protein [Striga asiatica]
MTTEPSYLPPAVNFPELGSHHAMAMIDVSTESTGSASVTSSEKEKRAATQQLLAYWENELHFVATTCSVHDENERQLLAYCEYQLHLFSPGLYKRYFVECIPIVS